MERPPYDIVTIGGSAGSIPIVTAILEALPERFICTVLIVLHRPRNVASEMAKMLSMSRKGLKIKEPDDKEPVRERCIYLVPQNYHLLIEEDRTFSLDYSEPINYSRPSIDLTFESVAEIYRERAIAVLLSGANQDGAQGIDAIIGKGGVGIAQDPATAAYPTMPRSAIEKNKKTLVFNIDELNTYLYNVSH